MINVSQSRVRSPNRMPTQSDKQPMEQNKTYLPPVGGLVTNTPLAAQSDSTAHILENFFPTATSIEPRGGSVLINTLPSAVQTLIEYQDGNIERFFAATATDIYEFDAGTQTTDDISTAVHSGMTSGDYVSTLVRNDAGTFLLLVNGEDVGLYYDGTTWQQLDVLTQNFSYVWTYASRVYFIESGTLNAYYLDTNAITGVPTKLPLSGVFKKGGSLLFGETISNDAGDGMDDRIIFVSDQGEVAIYTGTNPAEVDNWSKQGVYRIGRPLGKRAFMEVGGDIIVATAQGLVPISAAIQKTVEELRLVALSRPIEPDWNLSVTISGNNLNWTVVKWEDKNMALIIPPNATYCWVVNLETKAWTKFTGWSILFMAVLGEGLFYSSPSGRLIKCDTGGYDLDLPFECRVCYAFDHLGYAGRLKTSGIIKQTWRCSNNFLSKISIASDYNADFPPTPNAAPQNEASQATWDVSAWDVTDWAITENNFDVYQSWSNLNKHGYVLAPQVQLTSAQNAKLQCQLISLDFTYMMGGVIT